MRTSVWLSVIALTTWVGGTLLVAAVCFTGFGAIFTVAYVYPINAVLFDQAGGAQSAAEIRALASRWILFGRIRFLIGLIGFAAVLHAFRLPIPGNELHINRAWPDEHIPLEPAART